MKHLILEFAEKPSNENIDLSNIEYDHDLNLNVLKGTKTPAINFSDQATETFTKVTGEAADTDRHLKKGLSLSMDTSTETRTHNEVSDSDKNFRDLYYLSATRTLTESSEALDSDK